MALLVALKDGRLVASFAFVEEAAIGRRPSNELELPDGAVSGLHARVTVSPQGCTLEDVGSTGGTLVNGRRIQAPCVVTAEDEVRIGPYVVLLDPRFQPQRPDDPARPPADVPYELLERVLRLERDMAAASEPFVLLERALDCLVEVLGARRGVVFALEGPTPEVLIVRPEAERRQLTFSRRLIDSLSTLEAPTLIDDVGCNPLTRAISSIASDVRWVIAGPLVDQGKRFGLLYLESPEQGRRFAARDVAFMEQFCSFASDVASRSGRTRLLEARTRNLQRLHQLQLAERQPPTGIVASSPPMRALADLVERVAAEDVSVLITGESGTGKEVLAKDIHLRSRRSEGPFVPVHCMALSEELIEAELFGHAKGAFSGAVDERVGRMELAAGGTLFLDEVAELSLRVQVKLLRVLQERTFQRVGENQERPLDARIVSATNGDLPQLVKEGRFRQDLFYRICVFKLPVPPLRERPGDVSLLADYFVGAFNATMRHRLTGVDPAARAALERYPWPGNVRELRNVIEQAFVRARGDVITCDDLPGIAGATPAPSSPDEVRLERYPADLDAACKAFEREFILAYVRRNDGNLSATARELNTSRWSLYRKLEGHLPPRSPDREP